MMLACAPWAIILPRRMLRSFLTTMTCLNPLIGTSRISSALRLAFGFLLTTALHVALGHSLDIGLELGPQCIRKIGAGRYREPLAELACRQRLSVPRLRHRHLRERAG